MSMVCSKVNVEKQEVLEKRQKGSITSIQRFSIHDGPGIRTTVFLKGCYLNCFWCHNPESISPKPEVQFFPEKCIGCKICSEVCSQDGHIFSDQIHFFVRDHCLACGKCVESCCSEALQSSASLMTLEEVMEEIRQDIPFFAQNSGGITISGGEPMLQKEFTINLLKLCKKEKIHTAVETSAFCSWNALREILPYTDFYMSDIKHMDSEKHKAATGVDNQLILENAHRIVLENIPILFRTPVIPTFNDTRQEISAIADFVHKLIRLREEKFLNDSSPVPPISLELLRFHKMAKDKYSSLGLEYKAADLTPPSKEQMHEFVEVVKSFNVPIFDKWK